MRFPPFVNLHLIERPQFYFATHSREYPETIALPCIIYLSHESFHLFPRVRWRKRNVKMYFLQVRKSFFQELGIYDNETFIRQIYYDYIEGKSTQVKKKAFLNVFLP